MDVLRKKREDALAFLNSIGARTQTLFSQGKARGQKRKRLTRAEKRRRREERERAGQKRLYERVDELLGQKPKRDR